MLIEERGAPPLFYKGTPLKPRGLSAFPYFAFKDSRIFWWLSMQQNTAVGRASDDALDAVIAAYAAPRYFSKESCVGWGLVP